MNFVYYGHYAAYCEVGRVEALRQLGISYASIEKDFGILLPVMNMHSRFLRPAVYDDLLTIRTTIPRMPGRDMLFITDVLREGRNVREELVAGIRVTLVILEAGTRRRIDAPEFLSELLQPYF